MKYFSKSNQDDIIMGIPSSGKFMYDINTKIKRQGQMKLKQSGMTEPIHRMNMEDCDPRIISKDRWPIPLKDARFATTG